VPRDGHFGSRTWLRGYDEGGRRWGAGRCAARHPLSDACDGDDDGHENSATQSSGALNDAPRTIQLGTPWESFIVDTYLRFVCAENDRSAPNRYRAIAHSS
jgi:hypothetical protein